AVAAVARTTSKEVMARQALIPVVRRDGPEVFAIFLLTLYPRPDTRYPALFFNLHERLPPFPLRIDREPPFLEDLDDSRVVEAHVGIHLQLVAKQRTDA